MTGPSILFKRLRRYAVSTATPSNGLPKAMTGRLSCCSLRITLFQIDASSKAPCTRTMVGFWFLNSILNLSPWFLFIAVCYVSLEGLPIRCSCFGKHRLSTVVADEVERNAERDHVLEQEQAQIVHVAHALPLNGCARCR